MHSNFIFLWFIWFALLVAVLGYDYCDAYEDCAVYDHYSDIYDSLQKCYHRNRYAFLSCYKNIHVSLNKREHKLSIEEFDNFKCMLINSLMNCLELKTEIFCSSQDLNTIKMITRMAMLDDDAECNETGVVTSNLLQFSY